jgi:hypothetical protein
MQECEKSLKYKTEFVAALESKASMLGETIEGLNEKYVLESFVLDKFYCM